MIEPAAGILLIADPFLKDPNFLRTVVLLCEHQQQGSFGFVLNKQIEQTLDKLITDLEGHALPVYYGGPVQLNSIHFLHQYPDLIPESVKVSSDIYWGGNFENVLFLSDTQQLVPNHIKFFLGYSGWGPGQLNEELDQNSWIVCDFVTEELMFETEPTGMWRKALGNMGGRFSVYANYPVDPNLN
jgi:putative transcriptional regulator